MAVQVEVPLPLKPVWQAAQTPPEAVVQVTAPAQFATAAHAEHARSPVAVPSDDTYWPAAQIVHAVHDVWFAVEV